MEGFLKEVPRRQGFGGCTGICVKWISIAEDLEPVCVGTDIDAEPGKINIGRALHQSGSASLPGRAPGLGHGEA